MGFTRVKSAGGAALLAAAVCLLGHGIRAFADDPPAPSRLPDSAVEPEVDALISEARAAVTAKRFDRALPIYFQALRAGGRYAAKYAIRDEVLGLPPVRAKEIGGAEKTVVEYRIAEEREKDVAKKAGAFEGKGHVHAARRLHELLMGLVGMGPALTDVHRLAIERIDKRLCDDVTEEERKEIHDLSGDGSKPVEAYERAQKAAAEGRVRVALKVLWYVSALSVADAALREKARSEAESLRARTIAAISAEEKQEADDVWDDPHWKGIATSVSHQFIYIGAKDFVETISPADRVKMDLACVLLGDLVGRDMTEDGTRLTVYYKERFDFAGGVAGGKRIDIGNRAIGKPIAGALHWHEMSHCVFDVGIVYPGFTEGIANFGAVFLLDAMGQPTEADRAIASNRKQFQEDYLERRLRYWRIQPYGPSAGFLLTPITEQNPDARKGEWATYRTFFRALRQHAVDEPRDAERIRWFAYHWGEAFGWPMLEKVGLDRFPVVPEDRERVAAEEKDWADLVLRNETYAASGYGEGVGDELEKAIAAMHPGEWRDRARFALARMKQDKEETALRDEQLRLLGVLQKWKLCGPFYSRHAAPLFPVFPPEREIDLGAEYPNPVQIARWKDAKPNWDGFVDLIAHGYEYPDDAACYALAYLDVPKDVPDATFFLGFDDTCAMWIDGLLVEKWDEPHGWVRDHHAVAAPLHAGRNRVLLKVCNQRGAWAFGARVVHADRTPIEGLTAADPPSRDAAAPPAEPKGKVVFSEDFERTKVVNKAKFRVTAGSWAVDAKCLRVASPGNVLWRKFLIKPDLNKDPPQALLWLTDKDLAGLKDFAVEIDVKVPGAGLPRLAVTIHGEERDDGLSGHTLIVQPGGEGMEARLEEYDRLVYFGTAEIPKEPEHTVRIVRHGRAISCFVDGAALLADVDLPPLARPGIGLMAWSRDTGIGKIVVRNLKP